VLRVERDMQGHPESDGEQRSSPNAEEEERKRDHGAVQSAGGRVLRRVRLVEEPHGGQRIPATLSKAEPQVVVEVDEHAPRPEAH
jgi:hypothetical protein